MGIFAKYRLESRKGKYNQNDDFWRVSVNEKNSLLRLFSIIKPYIKHNKRLSDLIRAEKNILERNRIFGG